MVTFFDTRYHEAYKQLINELSEFLVVDDVDGMHIERLEFRSDLKRGDRKLIWQAFNEAIDEFTQYITKRGTKRV